MDPIQLQFIELLKKQSISLNEIQLKQFETYYNELVEWNEKINLTAITERDQVYMKHFYDSLSISFQTSLSSIVSLADIGSGAGFPSIPLKIVFPHLQITIVDSLNKRITFLKQLLEKLGIDDVKCIHGRAEDIARIFAYRDSFDLVTARAVARLSVLNEFCLPFVKNGGTFIAMKGSEVETELEEAAYSLNELRGKIIRVDRMELPVDQSVRHFVHITKTGPTTSKYPRKPGVPLKSPLIKN
ncbi:Ribosomal RNA small subunit methyltransferase G [compost metagenome]